MVSLVQIQASSTAHLNLGGTKLSVVEQQCCLCGSRLFENDGSTLCVALGSDLDTGDLTTGE